MRGHPLLELLLFGLVWGLLLVPLGAITRTASLVSKPRLPVVQEEPLPAWVQIRFTEPPIRFVLYSQNQPIWEEDHPEPEQEVPLALAWDEQGQADMQLFATWELAGRRATEVRVSLPVGPERRQLLWHETSELQEGLLFP